MAKNNDTGSLENKIHPAVSSIIKMTEGYSDDAIIAFFGCVALELWALNLVYFPPEQADGILKDFVERAKQRAAELGARKTGLLQ